MKKLLLLIVVGVGVFAVWRKVQADRAEVDLWTEATTDDN
ncbi:MAG TPA: DLW-39 family protein [Streptosporangiaceae bacterium]|nr:DLW-39 family protein [Streptosporangiaceae bacterium]